MSIFAERIRVGDWVQIIGGRRPELRGLVGRGEIRVGPYSIGVNPINPPPHYRCERIYVELTDIRLAPELKPPKKWWEKADMACGDRVRITGHPCWSMHLGRIVGFGLGVSVCLDQSLSDQPPVVRKFFPDEVLLLSVL